VAPGDGLADAAGQALVLVSVALVVLVPVALAGAETIAPLINVRDPLSAGAPLVGTEGLWLGPAWADGRHGSSDVAALVGTADWAG